MNTTIDLLNALIASTGAASDYALAKKMDVTVSAVSLWRNGKGTMSNEFGLKAAEMLGIDENIILAILQSERAKSEREKAAWRSIFERLGGNELKLPTLATAGSVAVAVSSKMYIMLNNIRVKITHFQALIQQLTPA